jgi:hypothetical protein
VVANALKKKPKGVVLAWNKDIYHLARSHVLALRLPGSYSTLRFRLRRLRADTSGWTGLQVAAYVRT